MTHRSLLLAAVLLLGACAHRADPSLPTCDGSARRPANPHGSVLAPPTNRSNPPATEPAASPATGGCA